MRHARTVPATTIRAARSEELDELLAIDDDASQLYASAGLALSLDRDHPFCVAERARWERSLARGDVLVAEGPHGIAGMAVLGAIDGAPYLDQLSVRMAHMGRGIGRALLARAIEWARGPLWLTTYDHLRWNRTFYERAGFVVVPPPWGPQMTRVIAEQRAALPDPHARIVMRRGGTPLAARANVDPQEGARS